MGEKVRDIASVAQKSLKCCRDGVTVCKGDTRFAEFTKEKWAIRLFKRVTAQSYKSEVKKTMMQHCIGVVGTVIETGAYILVLIIGAQNNEGRNRSWFTHCSVSDN